MSTSQQVQAVKLDEKADATFKKILYIILMIKYAKSTGSFPPPSPFPLPPPPSLFYFNFLKQFNDLPRLHTLFILNDYLIYKVLIFIDPFLCVQAVERIAWGEGNDLWSHSIFIFSSSPPAQPPSPLPKLSS